MARKLFAILWMVLATTMSLLAAPGPYQEWVGTWVYNYDKSTHDKESVVKMTPIFEVIGDDGMKFTRDATSAHGEPQHSVFIIKFDGKEYHAVGQTTGPTQAYRRIDDHTLECISKSGTGTALKQVMVLSKDGNSFVLTETGTYPNGKKADHYSVFERKQ